MLGCGFKSIIHSVTLRAKDSHGRSERSWKVGVPGHKEGKRNPLSSYFLLHAPPCEVSDICRRGHATGNFFYRGLSREYSSPCRPVSQLFNLVVIAWKQSLTIYKKCGGLFSSKTLLKKPEADCMWPMGCRRLTPGMRAGVPPPHGLPRAEPPRWFCHSKIGPQRTDGKASGLI